MKFKLSFLSIVSALATGGAGIQAATANEGAQADSLNDALADQLQYVLEAQERYIVKFKGAAGETSTPERGHGFGQAQNNTGGFEQHAATQAVTQVAGRIHKVMEKRGVVVASLDTEGVRQLKQRGDVESVSPDPIRVPLAQTTPYSYDMVGATGLVQSDLTAKKVCVIDTGIDAGHEDLPGRNNGLTGSTTGSQVGNWYEDGYGHGTHVAGTIAAYDNSYGSVGVFPGVNMHVVKVFNDNGSWTYASSIIGALDDCAAAGAEVVNMSLGGSGSSSYENQAMQEFESQGILMVAAAGNDGNSNKSYPASYDSVMSVAALGMEGNRAGYSQYNNKVEIAAPGTRIFSTRPNDNYTKLSGTSMATPHVAGGAALIWSFFPQCTSSDVRNALTATAMDKGAAGRDDYYGYGMLQVNAAYDHLQASCGGGGGGGGTGSEPVTVTKSDLSADTYHWNRFSVSVPEGTDSFTVEISGGSGDADLYVNEGSKPRYSTYDCRPMENGNNEVCTFDVPNAGQWYIGIRAASPYSGVTMQYSLDGGGQTTPDPEPDPDPGTDPVEVVKTDLSASENGWSRFSTAIPDGTTTLNVEISGGTGDADLYVKYGSIPKYRSYDCRPYTSGNEEVCTIELPEAGEWHFGVRADKPYTGVTLKYSYQ